jgi:predicted Holliday junction resolvase-like endonuclease
MAEQTIPAFPGSPYPQDECRPLFNSVDYLVFLNLARGGVVAGVQFVEAKPGDNSLKRNQKQVRLCIGDRKLQHPVLP